MNAKPSVIIQFGIVLTLALIIFGCSPAMDESGSASAPPDATAAPTASMEEAEEAAAADEEIFPEFPWPPPQASASVVIPSELVTGSQGDRIRLVDVNEKLTRALDASGYVEKSYFAVPDGYALVTRLEQINPDGTPKDPGRWSTEFEPPPRFSLRGYLEALFFANPGLYRIVVFVVTPHPFSQTEMPVGRDEAMDWLREGMNTLPSAIGTREYTDEFTTTALVYEFEQPESLEPKLSLPSRLNGREHLDNAGFTRMLEQSQ